MGVVFGLRSAVIALLASAALVLALAGVSAGVFTIPDDPPPVSQAAPVDPALAAPRPVQMAPDVAAPQPAPQAPDAAAPQPAPVVSDAAAPRSAPVHREPVAESASYRRVPVHREPVPAAPHPAPVEPAQNRQPVSPPPPSSSESPAPSSKSRTVNTEPCHCDGQMRKVSTHWDPPRG